VNDSRKPDAARRRSEAKPRRTQAEEAARRRRLRAVFGDVLPEGTGDEHPDTWGDRDRGSGRDEDWLRRQVPPHHG
jgi:hypothetical protein